MFKKYQLTDAVTFGGKSPGAHARDSEYKNKLSDTTHCNYLIENKFYVMICRFRTGRSRSAIISYACSQLMTSHFPAEVYQAVW